MIIELNWLKFPFIKKLFQKEFGKNVTKQFIKKIRLPKYNNEGTVKIEELHYVNQWYDNTKTIYKS